MDSIVCSQSVSQSVKHRNIRMYIIDYWFKIVKSQEIYALNKVKIMNRLVDQTLPKQKYEIQTKIGF